MNLPKGLLALALLAVISCQPDDCDCEDCTGQDTSSAFLNWDVSRSKGNAPFAPRDSAEGLVYKDRLWLSAGYFSNQVDLRDLWSTSSSGEWSSALEEVPYETYSDLFEHEGRMWAVRKSAWSTEDGLNWEREAENLPFEWASSGDIVKFKGELWRFGSGNHLWRSTDGRSWTQVEEELPFGDRLAAAVVVFRDRMWMMGGYKQAPNEPPENGYSGFTSYNDIWSTEDGHTWTLVKRKAPWGPRMWPCGVAFQGRLWLVGGFDNRYVSNIADVWSTENGFDWSETPMPEGFLPRHASTCVDFANNLWVIAGNSWPVTNDIWRLAPSIQVPRR